MSVTARYVLDHGQKKIDLIGLVDELVPEIVAQHEQFWTQ